MKLTFQRVEISKISTKTLIEKIKFRELTHQICFCTTESLFALELVDDDKLFEIEDISNAIIKKLSIENNMNELDAMKIFFNSKTYENLTKSDNPSFAKDKGCTTKFHNKSKHRLIHKKWQARSACAFIAVRESARSG